MPTVHKDKIFIPAHKSGDGYLLLKIILEGAIYIIQATVTLSWIQERNMSRYYLTVRPSHTQRVIQKSFQV